MKTTDLYKKKKECCGCEACSLVCPSQIIHMQPDKEGFLYPVITDESGCINCGRCLKVCPEKSPGRNPNHLIESFGGYSCDINEVKICSSGGYATAISREFVTLGGIVYGVRYTSDFEGVAYSRAQTIEELDLFRTSKYVQAAKNGIYAKVKEDLNRGKRVLFIGLPCEVSALYHYVGRNTEELYTISLICHGPTSPKVHYDFCRTLEKNCHSKLTKFSVREKIKGWKPYYIFAEFENGKYTRFVYNKSNYGMAFIYMKRPSCSVCRYKYDDDSFGLIADLTLGDFHAVRKDMPHFNSWGVSQACVQTTKGSYLVNLIRDSCQIEPIPLERVITGNIAYMKAIPLKKQRGLFVYTYLLFSLKTACKLPTIFIEKLIEELKDNLIRLIIKVLRFCKLK